MKKIAFEVTFQTHVDNLAFNILWDLRPQLIRVVEGFPDLYRLCKRILKP